MHAPFPARLDLAPFMCEAGERVRHYSELGGASAAAGARGEARDEPSDEPVAVAVTAVEGGHQPVQ